MQMSVESLPFGGVGESGMGAYHGKVKAAYSESLYIFLSLIDHKTGCKIVSCKVQNNFELVFGHSKLQAEPSMMWFFNAMLRGQHA